MPRRDNGHSCFHDALVDAVDFGALPHSYEYLFDEIPNTIFPFEIAQVCYQLGLDQHSMCRPVTPQDDPMIVIRAGLEPDQDNHAIFLPKAGQLREALGGAAVRQAIFFARVDCKPIPGKESARHRSCQVI